MELALAANLAFFGLNALLYTLLFVRERRKNRRMARLTAAVRAYRRLLDHDRQIPPEIRPHRGVVR